MKPDPRRCIKWHWRYHPIGECSSFNTWLCWCWGFTNQHGIADQGYRWFGWTYANFDYIEYQRAHDHYLRTLGGPDDH